MPTLLSYKKIKNENCPDFEPVETMPRERELRTFDCKKYPACLSGDNPNCVVRIKIESKEAVSLTNAKGEKVIRDMAGRVIAPGETRN
ncbi:MAG: hypothetical protein QME51_04660 [Planctomycetota bacterium]|nr:hypothetical protein [Planctomycetota bacterium]